ncbi:hypothetical protein N658DRAFT_546593 [Parathielavia hyrcaniae]|uniref:F-box domain-containing protein n=1 Tax=Parathielavia hyrcaniae TaxID=113614 RepID=A0AAN6PUA1_9PEZI|nr:hypothetical protein N658DRAFT_546593 [Parathielavia hyrcaniae]
MRRLPPELWLKICADLDLPDAASLRLACRTLSSIGAPFVLRELTLCLHSTALALLRAVASDPIKAASIRSLVYVPGSFYPLEHPDIKVSNYVPHSSGLITPATLQTLDRYKRACRDQARILSNDLDYELYADVLPQLTALRSFVIDCAPGRPRQQNHHHHHHQSTSTAAATHKGSITTISNLASRPWYQPTQHPHTHHGKPGRRALASLLRALDNSGSVSSLASIKALGLSWESFDDLAWAAARPRRPRLTSFFEGLRSLSLQFCLCGVLRRGNDTRAEGLARYERLMGKGGGGADGGLAGFLGAVPGLVSLAVGFCYGLGPSEEGGSEDGEGNLKGKQQRWPRLGSLSLGGLNLPGGLLMEFLGGHRSTLRRLELFSVWTDGDWPEMLQEMRGMLALEDAAVWTKIYSDAGQWHVGRPPANGIVKGKAWRGEPVNLATAVGRYLVNGGECPVTERNMIPATSSTVRGCYTCGLY